MAIKYIRTSKSLYGAPIFFVKKKDNKLKFCIDYGALNKLTIRNNYPLSRIDDIFDHLVCAKYFNRIDFKSEYYEIRIINTDIENMTCQIRYGLFMFIVMSFDLCNEPSTFTTLINTIFREEIDKFVIIYIDDILVYSDSLEIHIEHLRQVFKKLRRHQLYENIDKSEFEFEQINFLDHLMSLDGISLNMQKMQAIKN